ncbi:unnamed protein product [Ceratitis capitata]|uniref:(Mediterranean fruit fly) hypothetical protein n=1 Tax=Ceratitis capitata TaxID=7213 RepID=A0A811V2S9_CERCA|nr:unnamed protein product [Ceratitis capitata]
MPYMSECRNLFQNILKDDTTELRGERGEKGQIFHLLCDCTALTHFAFYTTRNGRTTTMPLKQLSFHSLLPPKSACAAAFNILQPQQTVTTADAGYERRNMMSSYQCAKRRPVAVPESVIMGIVLAGRLVADALVGTAGIYEFIHI